MGQKGGPGWRLQSQFTGGPRTVLGRVPQSALPLAPRSGSAHLLSPPTLGPFCYGLCALI